VRTNRTEPVALLLDWGLSQPNVGIEAIEGKTLVYDAAEPINIVRVV